MTDLTINATDIALDIANIHAASEKYANNQARRDGVPPAQDRRHRDLISQAKSPTGIKRLADVFALENVATTISRKHVLSRRELEDINTANSALEDVILQGFQRLYALKSSEEVDPSLRAFAGLALRELDKNLPRGLLPYDRDAIALAEEKKFATPSVEEVGAYYRNGPSSIAVSINPPASAGAAR